MDCSYCGAPIHTVQAEELSKEQLIMLNQRWTKWAKQNWQKSAAETADAPESPLLGTLTKQVGKLDKWISSNKTASGIFDRINDQIASGAAASGQKFSEANLADSKQIAPKQIAPKQTVPRQTRTIALKEIDADEESIVSTELSLQVEAATLALSESSCIDEQTLIEHYNQDVTTLKSLLTIVKQTRDSLTRYIQGLDKKIQLKADNNGKYWVVLSDRTQNNSPLYYLLLRKDIRLNQQSFNTIKACFTFSNKAVSNRLFTLIAPATARFLPDQQLWEIVKKGTIEFNETQSSDEA